MSNGMSRVNVGPILVEGWYNKLGGGATVRIYEGFREWLRIDPQPKNPQRHHYHINPYIDSSAVATARAVVGIETSDGLLEHLLERETLRGLAVQAGEVDVVDFLEYTGDSEVKAHIYRMVKELSGVERQN